MHASRRVFYKLSELAERWGKTEDELLHLAADGVTPLAVWYKGPVHVNDDPGAYTQSLGYARGFLNAGRKDVCELLLAGDGIYLRGLFDADNKYVCFGFSSSDPPVRFFRNDFVILAETVAHIEAEKPELLVSVAHGEDNIAEADNSNLPSLPHKKGHQAYPREGKVPTKAGGRRKSPLTEAVEKAYCHFLDTGNVDILKQKNIRSFLTSLRSLVQADNPLEKSENGNINRYIANRIKEVKIPRSGECSVITQSQNKGRYTISGRKHKQNAISKLLVKLRENYPLPS